MRPVAHHAHAHARLDKPGFVRISVKIIDVREAFFRVAIDADLARSVTGRGGGGDFADWTTCLPAKSFKHDQLLYVVSESTYVCTCGEYLKHFFSQAQSERARHGDGWGRGVLVDGGIIITHSRTTLR